MMVYDLYGAAVTEVDWARTVAEQALGFRFEARDSSYVGQYYLMKGDGDERAKLMANLNPCEGELREPEFPDAQVLLYVIAARRPDEWKATLEKSGGCKHLRRLEVE